MLSSVTEGEGKLLGALGANASLGGIRAVLANVHEKVSVVIPFFNDLLILVQVAVGVATLIYFIVKIRKLLREKQK